MRDLEKAYADLRAREEQVLRDGNTWMQPGQTGRLVLYFPMSPGYGDSLSGSVVTVRLGAATGSDLVVPVTLGALQGRDYVVAGGLEAGQRVVVTGVQHLHDGSVVQLLGAN